MIDNPTEQQARDHANAIHAWLNKEPFDVYIGGEWVRCNPASKPDWNNRSLLFRPAPKPKLRDWNCKADVPMPCWIDCRIDSLVVAVSEEGVTLVGASGAFMISWFGLKQHRHSTDRQNWKRCEVAE